MPRLSCWFIRAALLYLLAGFSMGALLLFHKGVTLHARMWQLLPLHIEFLLLGWTLQLAMGVAFWILPRHLTGPERGNEALAWLAFCLINGGVLLVGSGWLWGGSSIIPFLGRIAEVAAAVLFAVHVWGRIDTRKP